MAYFNTDAVKFIQSYRNTEDVVKKMNHLSVQGLNWNDSKSGILDGGSTAFFRGLIFSRLSADPDFPEKLEFISNVIHQRSGPKWVPYFEKLKEILGQIS
jgi:hypothetical protein